MSEQNTTNEQWAGGGAIEPDPRLAHELDRSTWVRKYPSGNAIPDDLNAVWGFLIEEAHGDTALAHERMCDVVEKRRAAGIAIEPDWAERTRRK